MYYVRLPPILSLLNAIFVQITHILHFEKGCPVDELVKTIKKKIPNDNEIIALMKKTLLLYYMYFI